MSSYVSRYHRIREWNPNQPVYGPGWVLDRKKSLMYPERSQTDEWERIKSRPHAWIHNWSNQYWDPYRGFSETIPPISGGSGWARTQFPRSILPFGYAASTQNTSTLNNAFTFNSAGNAVAIKMTLPLTGSKNLQDFYIFTTSVTATPPTLTVELRNNGSGKPGSTVHASKQAQASATAGWNKYTLASTFAMSDATRYWVVIYNSDGSPATNTATVLRGLSSDSVLYAVSSSYTFSNYQATTDGFQTVTGGTNAVGACVLKFDDSSVFGSPITTQTTPTSDANRKGLVLTASALTSSIKVFGVALGTITATSIGLFSGSTAPNGTAVDTSTSLVYNQADTSQGVLFSSVQTLTAGTQYRIILYAGGSSFTNPQKNNIGTVATGSLADLQAALFMGANAYYALATGPNTSWADDTSAQPVMNILIDDLVAGSSGTSVPKASEMTGGMG